MRKYLIYIKRNIYKLLRFLTYDIWRVDKRDKSVKRISLYNVIKTFILAFRNIQAAQISTRASALTYSTLLSIVPLLAVLFAIARGFGFQKIVESQIFSFFAGQEKVLNKSMEYIDNSIEYAQGGVFLGIGIILLLYTVINLLSNIEQAFNTSWGIKKDRTYYRMFTDYLALVIIAPIFFVVNAGLSVFMTSVDHSSIGFVISPFVSFVPFIITILLFTFLFSYIPNTKVKFTAALLGATFSGLGFQLFQWIYISGQLWISKYNAIYGGFAALPLLLLWLQLTWFIILIGVELSFAYQNVNKFSFENETENISRRYKDFVIIMVMSLIAKRFAEGGKPYTADEISENYKIPTKLTSDLLYFLEDVGLIAEIPSENDERISTYIPAMDINKMTVGLLFEKVNMHGSEDFVIDIGREFKNEWELMLEVKDYFRAPSGHKLLKDL